MKIYRIRKGLNIPLTGNAEKVIKTDFEISKVATKPIDFTGFQPKLLVQAGDSVLAGTPLMHDKLNEKIHIPSPVSGTVEAIIRGDKRVLQEIRIVPDGKNASVAIENIQDKREGIIAMLLQSGLWSLIRQRPFDVIPNPDVLPRDIYISTFDSAPLAPDYSFILKGTEKYLQTALNILSKLSPGNIFLGLNAQAADNTIFENLTTVEKRYFQGPHPAGNVGVQIHHTKPINKGETVWYLNVQDLVIIGKFFTEGVCDFTKMVAVTGPDISHPAYVKLMTGAQLKGLYTAINHGDNRVISGNVLTGTGVSADGYLGFYDNQISVIPEGNYYEFMGWASPGFKKYSFSKTFLSKLMPSKKYKLDTNYHGGERAYVVSGQYEKVFPFDIYPVYLIKAIMVNDIDKMEQLGIYEVSPEDFALCDFVCTSKIEAQETVRVGLENLRKEMN